jgi:septum formation protein
MTGSRRHKPRVVLASRSPARRRLLERAGFDVRVIDPDIAETPNGQAVSAERHVHENAWLKAQAGARQVKTGLVIAADTVAYAGGKVLGKPRDRSDARRMLELLSGTRHDVLTGLCLCRATDRLSVSTVETTTLAMRVWTTEEMVRYLESGDWEEKSGAYAIREQDDPVVERVTGSISNVVGIPLERLQALLREFPSLLD